MSIKIKVLLYKIGYRKRKNGLVLFEHNELAKDFIFLKAPFFHWLADPFIYKYNGKNYIFAECANIFSNKGHIRCVSLDEKKKKWKKIFIQKNHMSFPNVFERENNIYCIPETSQRNQIILFKSINFPYKWDGPETLIDNIKCVDSIVSGDNLFSYIEGYGLCQFKTNFELGTYEIMQSYKDLSNNLRPAGNPFQFNSKTFFPFQLNENHYGGGVVFCELSNYRFDEIYNYRLTDSKLRIGGIKECKGIHTYNLNEDYEVIDILYSKFSILAIL